MISIPFFQSVQQYNIGHLVAVVLMLTITLLLLTINYLLIKVIIKQFLTLRLKPDRKDRFGPLLFDNAPIGLGLIKQSSGDVLISNSLMHTWMAHDSCWIEKIPKKYLPSTPFSQEITLREDLVLQLVTHEIHDVEELLILCIIIDITDAKKKEQRLILARENAEAASAARAQFLSTMSHEIRTSLYGALATWEMMSLQPHSEQQKNHLNTLQYSFTSMQRIVDDSLDLSMIEAGKLRLEHAPFNPIELAERVITFFSAKAKSKNIDIYTLCNPEIPTTLIGDEIRLRQILHNLINNSLKFTDTGRIVLRIKVANLSARTITLMFEVADSGMGIKSADLPNLFDPYFQTRDHGTGTGLGLAICSRLVDMMAGTIEAVSIPEMGTRIAFHIPFPLAEDRFALKPITLPHETIFVEGASSEAVANICGWLKRWGADARPLQSSMTGTLVTAWPAPRKKSDWNGQHIVLLPPLMERQRFESNDIIIVNAYNILSLGYTLARLFQRAKIVESTVTE